MSVDPERVSQVATERKPWVDPQLRRLRVGGAEFGGGTVADLETLPS